VCAVVGSAVLPRDKWVLLCSGCMWVLLYCKVQAWALLYCQRYTRGICVLQRYTCMGQLMDRGEPEEGASIWHMDVLR